MKRIKLAGLLSLIIIGTFTTMTAFAGEWKTVTQPAALPTDSKSIGNIQS